MTALEKWNNNYQNSAYFNFIRDVQNALGDSYEITVKDATCNEDYEPHNGEDDTFVWFTVKAIGYEDMPTLPDSVTDAILKIVSNVAYHYNSGSTFEELDDYPPTGCVSVYGCIASENQREVDEKGGWDPLDLRPFTYEEYLRFPPNPRIDFYTYID